MRRPLAALLITCCAGCGAIEDATVDAGADAAGAATGDAATGDAAGTGADAATREDSGGAPANGTSAYFPAGSWFLEDVYDAPPAASSERAIQALRARGGWGNGDL